ncbi:CBM20 domain-containing protein [Hanstruepera ponticola]|uniref:hypothetical protein n=1 Tax=Hanstruepera ponticola TaxID=2042995 RepID=UPI001784418C|nr:hypothetical protein [Hanstruepera ponticola]
MKNSILIIAMALFTFSCNTEELSEPIEQNITLENTRNLSENIKILQSSSEFREFIASGDLERNTGNGIMLLDDGFNLSYAANTGESLYIIGGTGSIEAMPNGRARFSIHTNNPSAAVIDLATFSTTYSSDCVEGPLGTFNYNFISEYEVVVFEPIPGLVFTLYMPTGENASNESANGHCKVSNAQAMYDENFEFIGCTEATEYKTMRLSQNSGISVE